MVENLQTQTPELNDIHSNDEYIIEMRNITKVFPGVKANDNVSLTLRKGEIHALLDRKSVV